LKFLFTDQTSKEMKKFININKKYWLKNSWKKKEKGILVEGFLKSPSYLLQSGRVAKSIEEETGLKPIVLIDNYFSKLTNQVKLYKSFNIKKFIFFRRYHFNFYYMLKAFIKSISFLINNNSGDDLLNLKFDKIIIGDFIYDTIIRTNNDIYTIKKLKINHFKYIYDAYFRALVYKNILLKQNIEYVILSHLFYNKYGILGRLSDFYDAKVILVFGDHIKNYSYFNIKDHKLTPRREEILNLDIDKTIEDADEYINKRFSGELKQHDVINAFKNKKLYRKENIKQKFNIKNDKPNVFILPHAFSDAPHCSKYILYKDYYEWYEDTLIKISSITDANWFVKPHPSSHLYGEEGVAKELFKKHKSDNMYLVPDDFSTSSIKNIADVIVTIQGTAGLEFSCFGIPAIICGKAFYSGFGFTIEPESKIEYSKYLKNIAKIEKLNDDQILMAKKILAWIKLYSKINDNIMPENIMLPNDDKKDMYNNILSEINQNLNRFNPKNKYYYKIKKYF